MKVTVWRDKFVRGWTGDAAADEGTERFEVLDLADACGRHWDTDAHFVPYYVQLGDGVEPPEIPRLNLKGFASLARAGHSVLFDGAVFDLDDPEAHSGAVPEARPEWRADIAAALEALPAELSDLGRYDTRGGARLVFEFPGPVGPSEYRRHWRALSDALKGRGLPIDELKDLTRCYRLPNVVRGGTRQLSPALLADLAPLESETLREIGAVEVKGDGSAFSGIEDEQAPLVLADQITENRNVVLTRLGGVLRRAGMAVPEILDALRSVAARRAPDWTPEAGELEHIAESVGRYEAAPLTEAVAPPLPMSDEDLRFLLGSEAELARAVCEEMEKDGVELAYDRTQLFRYVVDRGVWDVVENASVQGLVATWDGAWIGTGGYNADGSPKARPLKVGSSLTKGVLDLVEVFRSSKGFFDGAAEGLTFTNGFVSVDKSGAVHVEPFRSSQRSKAALTYAYEPGEIPSEFIGMLRECFQGDADVDSKIELLREFVGACLLGAATTYQRGLIMLGDGANGKSTVQEIIAALFDGATLTAIPPQDMAQEYRRAMLADSRLNLVNELPEADILVSESVKAILSGDRIVGRFIREQPFTFVPRCGNLFAANELPGVRDMSRGFWRRWIVLMFSREFLPSEQDAKLAERIVKNEISAIASWAIEGAARLAQRGYYDVPTSSEDAVSEWRDSADVVSRFLTAKTVATDAARTKASELYSVYIAWSLANGHKNPLSSIKFGKRLKRLGVGRVRRSEGFFYARGVRLSTVPSPSSSEVHV